MDVVYQTAAHRKRNMKAEAGFDARATMTAGGPPKKREEKGKKRNTKHLSVIWCRDILSIGLGPVP